MSWIPVLKVQFSLFSLINLRPDCHYTLVGHHWKQKTSHSRLVYISIVLFKLLPWKPMKTGISLCRLSYTSFKIHPNIFNSSKLVNLFLSEGGPGLAHSKNMNFIGRECSNFEGDGLKYWNIVGRCQFFPKAPPISLIFVGAYTLHSCYILHIN